MKMACLLLIVLCSCTAHQRGVLDADTEVEEDVVEEQSDTIEQEPEADPQEEDVLVDSDEDEIYTPECEEDLDCDDDDECTVDTCEDQECLYGYVDADADGYIPMECGGQDCDDNDASLWLQECEGINPCCDGCSLQGCWLDETTGYMWQTGAYGSTGGLADSLEYCANLSLAGLEDWEVPSIDVLRTVIRGCPATAPSGSCPVTTSCLTYSCFAGCEGCGYDAGPNEDGSYHPAELEGLRSYWSSSLVEDVDASAFVFISVHGGLSLATTTHPHSVRCVNMTGE